MSYISNLASVIKQMVELVTHGTTKFGQVFKANRNVYITCAQTNILFIFSRGSKARGFIFIQTYTTI